MRCRASGKVDMNKIALLPTSFSLSPPPVLTIILKTATRKAFVCFNSQYTYFNLINTVAVRNVDYTCRACHQAFVPFHYFVMSFLLLSYFIIVDKT